MAPEDTLSPVNSEHITPQQLEQTIRHFNSTMSFREVASQPLGCQVPAERRVSPDDFVVLRQLGRGDVGRVYLVQKRDTEELFALKMLKKKDMLAETRCTVC
eukprot:TRINITY_DN73623_c0_g1_i1.p1 TRINITY_DN73623_c0_g1~~TRINITY_DN73623_c0_g1_i1.p1  ORF type:complete len:102 (+),score=14.97 TRINITY_DN73623_c0_g1_i1:1-306(+)